MTDRPTLPPSTTSKAVRTLEDVLTEEYPGEFLDTEALRTLVDWAKTRLAST